MRIGTVVAALFFASAAAACAVWLSQPSDHNPESRTVPSAAMQDGDFPVISKTPPWPKAVVDATEYNFGKALAGEDGAHTFVIRNEGEADLVLRQGSVQCRCTFSELAKKPIPPGGSGEVTLKWTPGHDDPMFTTSAEVRTNDPKNQLITLRIVGTVENLVTFEPEDPWIAGPLSSTESKTIQGTIRSGFLDEFQVHELITSEHATAEATPLTPEQVQTSGAKSGYAIVVTLHPAGPLGTFTEEVTVRTDIRGGTDLKIHVMGHRQGPIKLVQLRGVRWNEENQVAGLGQFPASEGQTGTMLVFVDLSGEAQNVEMEVVPTSPVKASLEKDANFPSQDRARFRLTLEVPPGLPPVTAIRENAPKVTLKTNHPAVSEYTFRVGYLAEDR